MAGIVSAHQVKTVRPGPDESLGVKFVDDIWIQRRGRFARLKPYTHDAICDI